MATETLKFSPNDVESSEDMADFLSHRTRLCFFIPSSWRRMRNRDGGGDTWWARGVGALRKLREWSEIAAGPRWKTFIRRFNRGKPAVKFHYDPMSYALNFDDGARDGNSDEEFGFRNFSCRYAAATKTDVAAFT